MFSNIKPPKSFTIKIEVLCTILTWIKLLYICLLTKSYTNIYGSVGTIHDFLSCLYLLRALNNMSSEKLNSCIKIFLYVKLMSVIEIYIEAIIYFNRKFKETNTNNFYINLSDSQINILTMYFILILLEFIYTFLMYLCYLSFKDE